MCVFGKTRAFGVMYWNSLSTVNGTKKPWRNEEGFVIMGTRRVAKYSKMLAEHLDYSGKIWKKSIAQV